MLVIDGHDGVELDAAEAVEVRAIQGRLKSFMGIPSDAVALVDGIKVSPAHVAQPTSTVEFRLERGQKAVGKVWTAQEYCQLFGLTEKEFEKQIREGLKVMQTANGAVVTETAVDNFIAGLNGNGDGAFLAVIASSLKRIADHVDPPPPDIVDKNRGGWPACHRDHASSYRSAAILVCLLAWIGAVQDYGATAFRGCNCRRGEYAS